MHVAIICDGNRRWAKERNLSIKEGYQKAIETVKVLTQEAIDLNIQHLTLFVLSTENVNRTPAWVSLFKEIIIRYLKSMAMEAIQKGCKVSFLGHKDILGYNITELIQDIEQTQNSQETTPKLFLNLCFGYSGRQDLIDAVAKMKEVNADPKDLRQYLSTKTISDPDLIIRTSGEMRLSNFLLFESAYSELFFIQEHFPDFTKEKLRWILKEFEQRERRYGK